MPNFKVYWKTDMQGWIDAESHAAAIVQFLQKGSGALEGVEVLDDEFNNRTGIEAVGEDGSIVRYDDETGDMIDEEGDVVAREANCEEAAV